jgi:hypothetical protein
VRCRNAAQASGAGLGFNLKGETHSSYGTE